MPPSLVVNRYKSVRPRRSRLGMRGFVDENFFPEIDPRLFRAWSHDAIQEAIKPVYKNIRNMKKIMYEERREVFNRISLLEDDIRNITNILGVDHNWNKRYSRNLGNRSHTVSLESINEISGSSYRKSKSPDMDMIEVKHLELHLLNKSREISSNEDMSRGYNSIDSSNEYIQSDEMDKTGFNRIRTRALWKAVQCGSNLTGGVTIGPNAPQNGWGAFSSSMETGLGGSIDDIDITPITKPKSAKTKREMKTVRLIVDEPIIDEENLCRRRILAELNKLSIMEAQEAKYRHVKQMEEHDRKAAEEVAKLNAQQQAEGLARQQAKMMEMAKQQEELLRRQQELAAAQANREETRKQQLEMEKQSRERMKQSEFFNRVYETHRHFSNQYREILEMLKAEEEIKKAIPDELEVIKSCQEKFDSLIAKCKRDEIANEDVVCAEHLLKTVTALNVKAKKEVERLEEMRIREREEEEQKRIKRLEEENKKKLEEEKKLQEQKKLLRGGGDVVGNCQRFQEYKALQKNLEKTEESLAQFSKDETLKKFRSDCQKAINVPVNAISAHSASHLSDKFRKLLNFLQKQTVVVSEKRITSATHPLGPLYSLNYLAVKTVKQGEQCVSSNPEAAYPIAAVVIALWTEMPEYGKLLLAHFYKSSPYLIPTYWERKKMETDEEYYKRLGFLYSGGEKEDMDKFLKRQSGIMRLYCAIIVTPHNRANKSKPHPLPLSEAWKWLTAFILLPPKADISATMLLEMLEVTGHLMMSTYGAQFRKLLHLICISYLPLVERVTLPGRGGPVTRLRGFLEGLISGKSIPPPKGLLSPNFW
uniref:mRNA export factor GLE1 n=1 Tax=Lygus hesperus TaxID=30085 RepID=A0A0K8SRQ9_LYGHE